MLLKLLNIIKINPRISLPISSKAVQYLLVFIISLFLNSLISSSAQAQNYSTSNKKAITLYEKASEAFKMRKFEEGMNLLQKAVEKAPEFAEAHYLLARNYQMTGKYEPMLFHYEQTVLNSPNNASYVGAYYTLAGEQLKKGNYQKAKIYAQAFLRFDQQIKSFDKECERIIACADFSLEGMKKPLNFSPKILPKNINKDSVLQYFPILSADQNMLIFTARANKNGSDENMYLSEKMPNGEWSNPKSLSENINSVANEGTCSISADGRVLVFTACSGRKGYGSCDLYISERVGNDWSEPKNLGANINSLSWESQPSLSADGKMLYFVSERKKGNDIYVSRLDDEGNWSVAENLGTTINTTGSEMSPFIHVNGRTLYFASNGRVGYGDYDLYYSNYENGTWSEPQNLGYPINNNESQISLFITIDGKKGYYADEKTQGNKNLYSKIMEFDMPPEISLKQKSNYVSGTIYNAKTKEKISANVDLLNILQNVREYSVVSDMKTGSYLIVLTQGAEYALEVHKKGFAFKSLTFNYVDKTAESLVPINVDIYLEPIATGVKFILNNIFFESAKYDIKDKSKSELDELIRFMQENETVAGEISGHTDNIGDDKANIELSLKRAKNVYDYLIKNGIEAKRLKFKGYGKTQPNKPNDTEENRKANRRIEFKVL